MIMYTPRLGKRTVSSGSNIFDEFDHFVDTFLGSEPARKSNFNPACDVNEGEDHFFVSFDVPGVKESDIKIEVQGKRLTVAGERHSEIQNGKGSLYSSERSYGSFQRSFNLPDNVNLDKIEANFENGVLTVAIPKKEVDKGRTIQIQTGKSGIFGKLLGTKKEEKTKEVNAS